MAPPNLEIQTSSHTFFARGGGAGALFQTLGRADEVGAGEDEKVALSVHFLSILLDPVGRALHRRLKTPHTPSPLRPNLRRITGHSAKRVMGNVGPSLRQVTTSGFRHLVEKRINTLFQCNKKFAQITIHQLLNNKNRWRCNLHCFAIPADNLIIFEISAS